MKKVLSLLALIAAAGASQAGSGGPPPFTNGSPLLTGIDGVYQAVASATNVTGLFGWAISGGTQVSGQGNNAWVFFVDGDILSGTVSANISNDKVSGVLDSGFGSQIPTEDDGTVTLPLVFVIPGNAGAGQFNGDIDLNSPIAAFEGEGNLTGTPARTDQIVFVNTGSGGSAFQPVTVTPVTIPGSSLGEVEFKFRGTRLSTRVSNSSSAQ